MLDNVLQDYIKTNLTFTGELYNEEAPTGAVKPYFVMKKISDPERPLLLCEEQGEAGDARFQFELYMSQTKSYAKIVMQDFKTQVGQIKGVIGTTEKYRLWGNQTSGVLALADVTVTDVRGALFDIKLKWNKV